MTKLLAKTMLPLLMELGIGALLATGAAGFSYLFLERAFQSTLTAEEADAESSITGATPAFVAQATQSAPDLPAPKPSPASPSAIVYPAPDSVVQGDPSTTDADGAGAGAGERYAETTIGWGTPVDGMLEVREDVPNGRSRFLPLHSQGMQRVRLRAGHRYIWSVLASKGHEGGARRQILDGPFRFAIRGGP